MQISNIFKMFKDAFHPQFKEPTLLTNFLFFKECKKFANES